MRSVIKYSLILLAISLLLVNPVLADATTPPNSIKFAGYVSYCGEVGIWWLNPTDYDFTAVELYLDSVYVGDTASNLTHFYTTHIGSLGTHELATHTKDSFGNVNIYWKNISFEMAACPTCMEGWFCTEDEWCTIQPDLSQIFQTPTLHSSSMNPSSLLQKSQSAGTTGEDTWMIFAIFAGIIAVLGFVYFYQR